MWERRGMDDEQSLPDLESTSGSMAAADIDRGELYVTNAVKHFKFTERGKRRIHQKPSRTEVVACRPWLFAELTLVAPNVLVLLGATAAQSLLGPRSA